jgi:hypothetical protein
MTKPRPKRKVRAPDVFTPKCATAYTLARELELEVWGHWDRESDAHCCQRHEACVELHALLDRQVWQEQILDTLFEETPPYTDERQRADWQEAHDLERALANAAGLPWRGR